MNNKYRFEDQSIGIYEHQIDLLRHKFVYDKIEYYDICSIKIYKGTVRNRALLLILALVSFILSSLIIIYVYKNSISGDFITNLLRSWYGAKGGGFIAVLFLIAFGTYSLESALKSTTLLLIRTKNKKHVFDIRVISKKQQTKDLANFLNGRVPEVIIEGI